MNGNNLSRFQWFMFMPMLMLMPVPMLMLMLMLVLMLRHNLRLRLAHGCKCNGRERVNPLCKLVNELATVSKIVHSNFDMKEYSTITPLGSCG